MSLRPFFIACLILLAPFGTLPAQVVPARADANGDGLINAADLRIVTASIGRRCGQAGFDPTADINNDCVVNVSDVSLVSRNIGTKFPPTIKANISPPANASGWHKTDASVSFECPGTPFCPPPVTVSTEGAGQVIERTVSNAGGSASVKVVLNIDKTVPDFKFLTPNGAVFSHRQTPRYRVSLVTIFLVLRPLPATVCQRQL